MPIAARPYHIRCSYIRTNLYQGNIALLHHFTNLFMVVPTRENRINLERYEIYSEQIVHLEYQYDVFDILKKFLWNIFNKRIFKQSL